MDEFVNRLRERKLVQWALAYAAFAFALLQGLDIDSAAARAASRTLCAGGYPGTACR